MYANADESTRLNDEAREKRWGLVAKQLRGLFDLYLALDTRWRIVYGELSL